MRNEGNVIDLINKPPNLLLIFSAFKMAKSIQNNELIGTYHADS